MFIWIEMTGHLKLVGSRNVKAPCMRSLLRIVLVFLTFNSMGQSLPNGLSFFYENGFKGIKTKDGKTLVPAIYDEIEPFESGRARAYREEKTGYLNLAGLEAIPVKFDFIDVFVDGRALAIQGTTIGNIDESGRWKKKLEAEWIGPFENGRAVVKIKGRWGLLNNELKWVVAAKYASLADAGFGYYIFGQGKHFGLLDENGHTYLKAEYDSIHPFVDGLCRVQRKGKWGLYHQAARMQIEPRFEQLGEFKNGEAPAVLNGRRVRIDIDGEVLQD